MTVHAGRQLVARPPLVLRSSTLKMNMATPEVHGLFHELKRSAIIVKEIMTKMRDAVEADVNCKVGKLSETLLVMY